MTKIINNIAGTIVSFDKGNFDENCVYIKIPNKKRQAPRDEKIFKLLKKFGSILGDDIVYNDFVKIYEQTDENFNPNVIQLISELVQEYERNIMLVRSHLEHVLADFKNIDKVLQKQKSLSDSVNIVYSVLYGTMIAEERKYNPIVLGKRIKRLAIYQVFKEGFSPEEAVNFSKNKNVKDTLDPLMKKLGF